MNSQWKFKGEVKLQKGGPVDGVQKKESKRGPSNRFAKRKKQKKKIKPKYQRKSKYEMATSAPSVSGKKSSQVRKIFFDRFLNDNLARSSLLPGQQNYYLRFRHLKYLCSLVGLGKITLTMFDML